MNDVLNKIQIYEHIIIPKPFIRENGIVVDAPIKEVIYKNNLESEISSSFEKLIEKNKLFNEILNVINTHIGDILFKKDINKLVKSKHKTLYEIQEICKLALKE